MEETMTFKKLINPRSELICDSCGFKDSYCCGKLSTKHLSKEEGWKWYQRDTKHLCPDCAKKNKKNERGTK